MKKNLIAAPLHIKGTKNAENKENLTLEELIDRGYQEDPLPNRFLQPLPVMIFSVFTAYHIFLRVFTAYISRVKVCVMIAGRLSTI